MATLDSARAALVLKEYRYVTVEDTSIKTIFPATAREILIEVNTDATGGAALANAIFNGTKAYARGYEVTIQGVMFLEDLVGGFPRYTLAFDHHPATGTGTYTAIAASIDFDANRTTLTVRG